MHTHTHTHLFLPSLILFRGPGLDLNCPCLCLPWNDLISLSVLEGEIFCITGLPESYLLSELEVELSAFLSFRGRIFYFDNGDAFKLFYRA